MSRRGRSSDAADAPTAAAGDEPYPIKIKLFLDSSEGDAYLIKPPPTALETSGGRGRSIRRLRRDVDEGLLPAVEWDDNIIGQRATVLLGDHVWEEALVIGVAGKSHTLRLADGRDLLISLPDHRVILHAELAHDPMAAGEAAAATDATPSGLPPAAERFGLTLPQRLEIYDKVRELRAGKVAADETLHGWRVELVPRANNETVIDFYVMRPDAPSRSSAYRSFPALEIALDVPAGGSAGGAASPVAADEDAAAAAAPTSEAVGKPPDEATTAADEANSHPGVTCDRSGMCPIIGTRYHLRGEDYDLCQEEWDKLPSDEKKYDAIPPSEATPMDIVAAKEPAPPPPPVQPPAGPYRLFLSTLNSTGFRYVRPVANLGGRSKSGQFECAFYVEGKEHNLANGVKADSGFDSAEEAAYMYASFARNHPIDEHHFPLPFEEEKPKVRGGGGSSSKAAAVGFDDEGPSPPPKAAKKQPGIEYDGTIVGRRVRALFDSVGEWYDGAILSYEAPKSRHGKGKFIVKYDIDGVEEEVTLPDDTIRLLPVQAEGEAGPPLTKEEERRAYKCQVAILDRIAQQEIENGY